MERHEYAGQGNLDLARGHLVRIEDGRGLQVRVTRGSVWITEEGDTRDRFVSAGGRFRVESRGLTLVSALSRSTIALEAAARPLFKSGLQEQGRKLMAMISMAVGALTRLDTIVPAVRDLGRRHAGYGVNRHFTAEVASEENA